jgi:hypothetical protein
MYFSNFPKIVYDFDLSDGKDYRVITDVTRNVRLRKQILENIALYDTYDIVDGDTPEIISEKIYGTPLYHWVIMLVNQRYDYINDFPLTQRELDEFIERKYGENKAQQIHHYEKNGFVTEGVNNLILRESPLSGSGIGAINVGDVLKSVSNNYVARVDTIIVPSNNTTVTVAASIRQGKFELNETLTDTDEILFVEVQQVTVPSLYYPVSNFEYETKVNESKRRIKIVDPTLVEQLVKEFEDIL